MDLDPLDPVLQAELLLAATGLLDRPDRTSMLAAEALQQELTTDPLAALDREDQAPLRVNNQKASYHKRLAATPPYEALGAQLELTHSPAVAAAYQEAHQRARGLLLAAYPAVSLDGIFGTAVVEPDHEAMAQWLLLVDTVETQRIAKDVNAAAVLPEAVDVFAAAYPRLYGALLEALNDELAARRDAKWAPAPWQETALSIFQRRPPEPVAPAPLPTAPAPSRVRVATAKLETAGDRA